jgi:hypothetical protein
MSRHRSAGPHLSCASRPVRWFLIRPASRTGDLRASQERLDSWAVAQPQGMKRRKALLIGMLIGGLAGCGVPAQPNAQKISVDRVSLSVREPERSVTTFLLVGGSKLYGRPDCIPLTLDLKQSAVAELVNLRKPLSATDAINFDSSVNRYQLSIDSIDAESGTVIVDVSKASGFKTDYLAIGQVVKSLTSIEGIERVGLIEKVELEGRSVEQLLPSVKIAGSVDAKGVKNGELLLPASKDSFVAVEAALVPFFFLDADPVLGTRLVRMNKYVAGFDSTDSQKTQAAQYLSELELGPTGETVAAKEARKKFANLGAQIEQAEENGPLKLTMAKEFDLLQPKDQALALGQLLLTLELIPSFAELPPVEFYVNAEKNPSPQRRTKVPNDVGDIVEREFLSPRDYDKLAVPSNEEIASSRECR